MPAPLNERGAVPIIAAMAGGEDLRSASSAVVASVDPRSRAVQFCLDQYFAEIAARFRGGFDADDGGAREIQDFAAPGGAFLLATLCGEPIGCGGFRALSPGVGEIKRMWVARHARWEIARYNDNPYAHHWFEKTLP